MTESMNVTTQFVSETQVFFRQNLDSLIDELETFDEATTQMLDENLEKSKQIEDARIQAAIEKATARQQEREQAPAGDAG